MNAATRKSARLCDPGDLVVVATVSPAGPGISVDCSSVSSSCRRAVGVKSGWAGAIAAMVLSSGLAAFTFKTSVPRDGRLAACCRCVV